MPILLKPGVMMRLDGPALGLLGLAPARAASKSQPSMFSSSINLLKRKAAAISVGSLIKDAVHGEFCKINSSFCYITEYFTN